MLRRLAFLLMALLPLGAQTRLPMPTPMPGIQIKEQDRSQPARLNDLRISVKVVGHVATTTWDLTVFNPQERVLEGELVFPLGEGQTVTRFAMDVNGRLREGVVVEKAKGRTAFEEIVRRNVDPGLLEKTAGNTFKARVYPIPAKGYKRVVLAYEQELPDAGTQGLLYQLPLAFTDKAATFGLRVEVLDQPEAPRATSSPLANFAFKAVQRGFIAEETRQDFAPSQPLAVVIPRGEGTDQVFVEKRDGQAYFFGMVHPRLPREAKVLPKRLLVIWDASASARSRDLKRELDLLEGYLKRLGTCTVSLAVFRNAVEPLQSFRIQEGNARALRSHLEALPLDGATRLGALDLPKVEVDETLLFSDGMNTFGPGDAKLPAVPMVAINSALTAEHGLLRALSEGHGGEYLNLQNLSLEDAAKALTTRPLAFLRATYGAGEVTETYPSAARAVRGPFGFAGILNGSHAKITLHFGFGTTTRFTKTLDIDAGKATVNAPVARLWAQKKLVELELNKIKHAAAITALGQAHSLVTEGTSLIVLDELADYLRYKIVPPEELRAEYERRIGEEKDQTKRLDQEHLEGLVKRFEERKTWWMTEFKAPKDPERKDKKEGIGPGAGAPAVAGGGVGGTGMAVGSVPPPPPSPSQPRPSPTEGNRARQEASAVVEVMSMSRADRESVSAGVSLSPGAAASNASSVEEKESAASITLKPWSPDTPYLKELKAAPKAERYALYLKQRDSYGKTPG
ncbi:MAG: VIT domain-containing protein, partial [Holophaga sp.]|nr:VIT domain-containing protein [Holophaga sp.]